jgi:hypothetical protein
MDKSSGHPGLAGSRPAALVPGVTELVARFTSLWNEGGRGRRRPDLGRTFSSRERRPREKAFSSFVEALCEESKRPPLVPDERNACQKRIFAAFRRFARDGLDWQDRHIDILFGDGFDRSAAEFVRMARGFDADLGPADIFQASRNVWVANGLQRLLGLPVRLTPSIFAYSLLYPYTDNYLDDPSTAEETKRGFNGRLRSRLEGGNPTPAEPRERTIFSLVAMIEGDHDRSRHPQVFESLIAIHEAQTKSLRLLRSNGPPSEADALAIVLEKGGTSVLADGCLVAGNLAQDQVSFLFGFGALLQLMDDLEDVPEDRKARLWTVFSRAAGNEPLDEATDRTLSFGQCVLAGLDRFSAPGSDPLRELIQLSLSSGVIASAGRLRRFYRRSYLKELESHSPFRFSFYDRERRRLERRRALLARLFELLAES